MTSGEELGQLLGGGALALVILREVFNFIKDRRDDGSSRRAGDQSIEFWTQHGSAVVAAAVTSVIKTEVHPLLTTSVGSMTELQKQSVLIAGSLQMLTKLAESNLKESDEIREQLTGNKESMHREARELGNKLNELQRTIERKSEPSR